MTSGIVHDTCLLRSFAGIKVALPCESASGRCFLQLYIESILALQEASGAAAAGRTLPLAIMTSDDTHAKTAALLKKHNYFGMQPDQVCVCVCVSRELLAFPSN